MSNSHETGDRFIAEFAENYMEKLFYFCLKKTGNSVDAEDLTQDIALNIIIALNKGTVPESFSAWVWKIARNRYYFWANEKHRKAESVTGSDIGDYEIEDGVGSILDEMIHSEQLSLLRRELAFIKSDYRDIVVAYYIDNRSVRDIASSLSLSVNAVQQRLHRARIVLKEGMDMAREFGKRSYNPEQVTFVMNGRNGMNGQPWSIITHLLYENIFLETYENPQTAEELSLELGIALPYMEDELEFLVREQLLRKDGNKYQTDFQIVSREKRKSIFDANKRVQKPLTDKICELIDLYMREDGTKVNVNYVGYDVAKWALLIHTFDRLVSNVEEHEYNSPAWKEEYPSRPNDGAWMLTGYETIDWQEPPFVGQHGYICYDKNEMKKNIEFGQFKFRVGDLHQKTPEFLTYTEAYTLWLVCSGKMEASEQAYLEKMLEYGYIKKTAGVIEPNVVIFDRNAEKPSNADLNGRLTALKDEICDLIKEVPCISRGYVVEQALSDGWIKLDENIIDTVGAFIYL